MKLRNTILAAVLAASCILSTGCGNSADSGNSAGSGNSTSNGSSADTTNSTSNTSSAAASDTSVKHGEYDGNVNFELKAGDTIAEITIEGYGTVKAKLFPEVAPVGVDNFVKLAESGYFSGKTIHRVVADFMLQGGSENGDGTGGDAADGGDFGIEPNSSARHFYGALCYANAMGRITTQFYIVNNKESQNLSSLPVESVQQYAIAYLQEREKYEQGTLEYNYYNSQVVYYTNYYTNLAEMLEKATPEVKEKYTAEGGTPSLDGGYTVFGQVYEGFEVIDAISACEVELSESGELSSPVDTITITSVTISTYEG